MSIRQNLQFTATQNDLVRVVNHAEVRQIVPFALNSKLANWVVVRNQQ